MPPALVNALQQPQQLQALYTETPMHPAQLQMLPPSLSELSVILRPAQEGADSVQFDLCHLTALTSLALQCAVPISAQTGFPDSLLSLCVEGACHAVCGTCLQSLNLAMPNLCMELVGQMQHLPALRDFAFVQEYNPRDRCVHVALPCQLLSACRASSTFQGVNRQGIAGSYAAAHLSLWHFVQRCKIVRGWHAYYSAAGVLALDAVCCRSEVATLAGMTAVVGALAVATQLTALTFNYTASSSRRQEFARLPLGATLEDRQNLEHLHIKVSSSTEADLIKLTAVTRLTHLRFGHYGDAVMDLVVAALAVRLQHLQVLHLEGGCVDSPALLAPIGALPELKSLDLQESGLTVTDVGLMQLSTLTQLTRLYLGERDLSAETVQSFLAAMPRLHYHTVSVAEAEADSDDEA
jgi:hypothetical protein